MEKEEERSCGSKVHEIFFFLILAVCTSILILSVWTEPQKFTCIVIVYLLGMTEAI